MDPVPAIFRFFWQEGDEPQLAALFPTVPADDGSGAVECYLLLAPFGLDGFGSGDFDDWMECGRLATRAEYARLAAMLEELGRPCQPVSERTPEMLAEFQSALARLREG